MWRDPVVKRVVRRRTAPIILAAAMILSLLAAPVSATIVNDSIEDGQNITVFHNLDFVAVFGYGPVGSDVTIDVVRNGVTIGTASGPTVDLEGLPGLEVNHGPAGVPQDGDCWEGHTPDIQPGDHIVVSEESGDTDEVVVDNIRFTDTAPVQTVPGGPITVSGTALFADGTPIPLGQLDSAGFLLDSDLRGGPDRVEATPGVVGGFTMVYESPYEDSMERNRNNLTEAEIEDALLGGGHDMGFGHVDPLPLESMLVEGLSDVPAPALGCEGSPASFSNIATVSSKVVNFANQNDDITVTGIAQDGTTSVDLTLGGSPAGSDTPGAEGEWSVTIPGATVAALADGALDLVATFNVPGGATDSDQIMKDTVAPSAPTSDTAAGLYRTAKSVQLLAPEAGAKVRYTTDGSDPNALSLAADAAIQIDETKTLKARAEDAAGNLGEIASFAYTIDTVKPGAAVKVRPFNWRPARRNLSFTAKPEEQVRMSASIVRRGVTFKSFRADNSVMPSETKSFSWNGRRSGRGAPAGLYKVKVKMTDLAGNTRTVVAGFLLIR